MLAEVPDVAAAAAAGHLLLQLPSSYIARDEEVAELALVMADVSTNLVMLTGAGARPVAVAAPPHAARFSVRAQHLQGKDCCVGG